MRWPFWLNDDDWEKNLAPRASDSLGDDEHLTGKQKKEIEYYKLLDRRSEWTARMLVSRNNLFLLVFPVILALTIVVGPSKIWGLLQSMIGIFK